MKALTDLVEPSAESELAQTYSGAEFLCAMARLGIDNAERVKP